MNITFKYIYIYINLLEFIEHLTLRTLKYLNQILAVLMESSFVTDHICRLNYVLQ